MNINVWNAEKIRDLRRRLGWSPSDLARRLKVESQIVIDWELGQSSPLAELVQNLELIAHQADFQADEIAQTPLAEIMLDESHTEQINLEVVKRRFTQNN
jgi:ribosome-binding protein aMBF1 (putative translation factor)